MTKQKFRKINALVNIGFVFMMGGCTFMVGYYLIQLVTLK